MPQPRRLATILALDVAGYSRAAERDEVAAAAGVRELRALITEIITPFGGRIFNSAGDGFMLEFPVATAGVEAAAALMRAAQSRARPLPQIRIGLHIGEVMVEANDDLMGHGINVAARLQALAEPGAAMVSEAVRMQMRAAQHLAFHHEGRFQLDKMNERIEVYSLSVGAPIALSKIARRRLARSFGVVMALLVLFVIGYGAWREWGPQPPPPEPLLAVLPFDAAAEGEAAQIYARNISSELHYTLSQSGPGLQLIARASSNRFVGAAKNVRDVRERLGVTHVLDGSVERIGDQITITLELIDAANGRQIWRERRSADIRDVQGLLERLAARTREALQIMGAARTGARPIDPRALDLYFSVSFRSGDNYVERQAAAIDALRQAVTIEPGFDRAWLWLAYAYATYRWSAPTPEQRREADREGRQAADRLLQQKPNDAEVLVLRSWFEPDPRARDEFVRRALDLDPGNSLAAVSRSRSLRFVGRGEDAYTIAQRALVLDPLNRDLLASRAAAALQLDPRDARVAPALRALDPARSSDVWPSYALAWFAEGDGLRGRDAIREYAGLIEAMARNADTPEAEIAAARERLATLREISSALNAEPQRRARVAAELERRARASLGQSLEQRLDVYAVEAPAISLLAGADSAFGVLNARIDALPRPQAGDARFSPLADEREAFGLVGANASWRGLHADPRIWSFAARLVEPFRDDDLPTALEDLTTRDWPPDF